MIGPLSRSGPVLRAFTRSAALRRSVGLVGVVVALLAFTFTFSMAFTKSADQRVAWDLGKAEASARGWRSVDIGHGPTALIPFEGSADRLHASTRAPRVRGSGPPARHRPRGR